MKRKILGLAAVAEAATGIILLAYPPIVIRLLFDVEVSGIGVVMSRIAGIALIGLGVACWPGNSDRQQLCGMLTYSMLAMLYLLRIGIRGAPIGVLLWPAVVVHAALSVLLLWMWSKRSKTPAGKR
jgi:hypothetical protein